jgi:S1-C subfamily serine protease
MNTRIDPILMLAAAAAVLIQSAAAHVPRPSAVARHELTLLDAGAMPRPTTPSSRHEPSMLDKLAGATLVNPTERTPVAGVVVFAVNPWSAMWRNGLRPSDVIVSVGRDRVRSLDELERALGKVTWGFVLEVARQGERIWIFVP